MSRKIIIRYPDRRFEKGIFDELAKHNFEYKEFNNIGVGTLHYDMENAAYNTNLQRLGSRMVFPVYLLGIAQSGREIFTAP